MCETHQQSANEINKEKQKMKETITYHITVSGEGYVYAFKRAKSMTGGEF